MELRFPSGRVSLSSGLHNYMITVMEALRHTTAIPDPWKEATSEWKSTEVQGGGNIEKVLMGKAMDIQIWAGLGVR